MTIKMIRQLHDGIPQGKRNTIMGLKYTYERIQKYFKSSICLLTELFISRIMFLALSCTLESSTRNEEKVDIHEGEQ